MWFSCFMVCFPWLSYIRRLSASISSFSSSNSHSSYDKKMLSNENPNISTCRVFSDKFRWISTILAFCRNPKKTTSIHKALIQCVCASVDGMTSTFSCVQLKNCGLVCFSSMHTIRQTKGDRCFYHSLFDKFEWIQSLKMETIVYILLNPLSSSDIGSFTLSVHFWMRHIIGS